MDDASKGASEWLCLNVLSWLLNRESSTARLGKYGLHFNRENDVQVGGIGVFA